MKHHHTLESKSGVPSTLKTLFDEMELALASHGQPPELLKIAESFPKELKTYAQLYVAAYLLARQNLSEGKFKVTRDEWNKLYLSCADEFLSAEFVHFHEDLTSMPCNLHLQNKDGVIIQTPLTGLQRVNLLLQHEMRLMADYRDRRTSPEVYALLAGYEEGVREQLLLTKQGDLVAETFEIMSNFCLRYNFHSEATFYSGGRFTNEQLFNDPLPYDDLQFVHQPTLDEVRDANTYTSGTFGDWH